MLINKPERIFISFNVDFRFFNVATNSSWNLCEWKLWILETSSLSFDLSIEFWLLLWLTLWTWFRLGAGGILLCENFEFFSFSTCEYLSSFFYGEIDYQTIILNLNPNPNQITFCIAFDSFLYGTEYNGSSMKSLFLSCDSNSVNNKLFGGVCFVFSTWIS